MKNLVLDEAHSLEDIITNALRKSLSYTHIETLFQKITKKLHKYNIQDVDTERCMQRILFEAHEIFNSFESSLFEKFSLDARYKNLLIGEDYFTKHDFLEHIAIRIHEDFIKLEEYFL